MTPQPPDGWLTISQVAHDFNRTRQTIHDWVVTGFIITLGYQVRRDYRGYWLLLPPTPQ